jgi:hypothetical protein
MYFSQRVVKNKESLLLLSPFPIVILKHLLFGFKQSRKHQYPVTKFSKRVYLYLYMANHLKEFI